MSDFFKGRDFYAECYDILVAHAGALPDDRERFSVAMTNGCTEWRFQGLLGFGGKFWSSSNVGSPVVSCYREDETEERKAIVELVNKKLSDFYWRGVL